jgi:NarL family two-component system response regulator LiaR
MNGVEATKYIHEKHPNIKILALSSFQDQDSVYAMLENGALGYVLKDSGIRDLESTIRAAHDGKSVLSPEVTRMIVQGAGTPEPQDFYGLSRREHQVLQLVATGISMDDIAEELFISKSTVKYHLKNILAKMKVETREEAIALAAKSGLI